MAWRGKLSDVLMGAAALGAGALVLQRFALTAHLDGLSKSSRHLNGAASTRRFPISILKPLAGADDGLADNLEIFATLSYSPYELLLGVRSKDDAAYPIAEAIAARHPQTVKVVMQEGEPGLNPKVNQLITLARHAKHPILLISDSNVRPPIGYLDEMSQMFEDPTVGCATNPVSGMGHKTVGSMLDNLHAATTGALYTAGQAFLGQAFVVGKSQALRRDVLQRLGGFEAYKDILAEDFFLGRDVQRLGMRVACGRLPVFNFNVNKTVGNFADRYARWSTMQATAMGNPLPAMGLAILNPLPLAAIAAMLEPTSMKLKILAGLTATKIATDISSAAALGVRPLGIKEALMVPVKDAVLAGAWAKGLFTRTVSWRGNSFRVGAGTKLTPINAPGKTLAQLAQETHAPAPAAPPAPRVSAPPVAPPQPARAPAAREPATQPTRVSGEATVPARARIGFAHWARQRARFRSRGVGH